MPSDAIRDSNLDVSRTNRTNGPLQPQKTTDKDKCTIEKKT